MKSICWMIHFGVFVFAIVGAIHAEELNSAPDPDYVTIPPEVQQHIQQCDLLALTMTDCAKHLASQFKTAVISNTAEQDKLHKGFLAEAAYLANRMLADQSSNQVKNQQLQISAYLAQQAVDAYVAANHHPRKWAMLVAQLDSLIASNWFSHENLGQILTLLDSLLAKLPDSAPQTQFRLMKLHSHTLEVMLGLESINKGGVTPCGTAEFKQLPASYQRAANFAKQQQLWSDLVELTQTKANSWLHRCNTLEQQSETYRTLMEEAKQIAIEHGLNDKAVMLTLFNAKVVVVNAPGHPQVIEAKTALLEAEKLAKQQPILLMQVLIARYYLALQLGQEKDIELLAGQFETTLASLTPEQLGSINWQQLVTVIERAIKHDINKNTALPDEKILEQVSSVITRLGNSEQQHRWAINRALFMSDLQSAYAALLKLELELQANTEVMSNSYLLQVCQHNLAMLAEKLGDIGARRRWLTQLAKTEADLSVERQNNQYGLYTYYRGLEDALSGKLDEAMAALSQVSLGYQVADKLVEYSQQAIERKRAFSQDLVLGLNGPMLRPYYVATFEQIVFEDQLKSLENEHVYLQVSETATTMLPQLTVGKNMRGNSAIYRDITQLALTANGKIAVHCLSSGRCVLWQTSDGRTLGEIQAGSDAILWLRIHPDGQSIFTVSGMVSPSVKQWSIDTGELLASYSAYAVSHIALSKNGRFLLTTDGSNVLLWDTHTYRPIMSRQASYFSTLTSNASPIFIASDSEPDSFILPFRREIGATPELALFRWNAQQDKLSSLLEWQAEAKANEAIIQYALPCFVTCSADSVDTSVLDDIKLFAKAPQANTSLLQNDQGLWINKNQILVSHYRFDTLAAKQMHYNEQGLWLINGAGTRSSSDEFSLYRWDLDTGRSQRQTTLPSWDDWYLSQDALWQFLGSSLRRTNLNSQVSHTEITLPRWEDGSYPEIKKLWLHQDALWLVESNGYYGNQAQYRVRTLNPTTLSTQKLSAETFHKSLIAVDNEHNRLLLGEEPDYGNAGQFAWVDADDGEVSHTFSLPYDWSKLSLDNVLSISTTDTVSILVKRYKELKMFAADGSEILSWRSQVGDITSWILSADKQSLWLVADGEKDSFIYQLALSNGHILQRKVIAGQIMQLSLGDNGNTLLARNSDGVVHWWPIAATRPMASLMQLKDDGFLVVNEQGFYDSNRPGDIPAVSWVLKDEPRRALPLEAFMRDFYQPGLFGRLRAKEQIALPVNLATLNRTLPKVNINHIQAGEDGKVSIEVSVSNTIEQQGESGAIDLRLFRDGQLVGYFPQHDGDVLDGQQQRILTFDNIALPNDTSLVFSAYAFNQQGVRSERVEVPYIAPKTTTANEKVAFIISIGVNEYQNSAWDLRYAANDASVMQQDLQLSLSNSKKFDKVVSIPLISAPDSSLRASKSQLKQVIDALYSGEPLPIEGSPKFKADINDVLFISFSGHGYVHNDGQFYFLMEDIGEGQQRQINSDLLSRALSSDELSHWLRPLDVSQMVMIVDACHSAASIASDSFKPGPMGSRGLGQLAYDKAMLFLTASQAEQVAMESSSLQHGFLSYALLVEGLDEGKADFQPTDNKLDVHEWLSYGAARVPQISQGIMSGTPIEASRGFNVKRKQQTQAQPTQKPYLFDFSAQTKVELQTLNQELDDN